MFNRSVRILLIGVVAALAVSGASCGPASSGSSGTAAAVAPAGTSSAPAPEGSTPATTAAPTAAAVRHPSAGCGAGSTTTAGTAGTGTSGTSGTEARTLATPAGDRTYRITRPAVTAPATSPPPLMLMFHGFAGSAEGFSTLTKLPERGAAAGFVVVAPDGTGALKTWQFSGQSTDASFVDALIDEVARTTCIDLDRITATGFSAGAAFTLAYSCAHQDRIHAIATVAVDFQLGCKAPMSILAFHGTVDPMVPYENEAVGLSLPGVKVRGTDLNMGDWAKLGGCAPAPKVDELGSEVRRSTWSGCAPKTDVVLYAIQGGGHTWPGADPTKAVGLTTQQVDATAEVLAFFQRDHLPPA